MTLTIAATFVPFGFAVFCNLLATRWPDREADATVGKRTLATRWSRSRLRTAYAAGMIGIVGSAGLLWVFERASRSCWHSPIAAGVSVGYTSYTSQRSPGPTAAAMLVFVAIFLVSSGVVLYG